MTNPSTSKCCEKCYSTYTEKTWPAHTVYDACINQGCECHSGEEKPDSHLDNSELGNSSTVTTHNQEPVLLVRGCRCQAVGQAHRKDVCHHMDKACHVLLDESERCQDTHNQEERLAGHGYCLKEEFDKWMGDNIYEAHPKLWKGRVMDFISQVRQSAIQEERERLAGLVEDHWVKTRDKAPEDPSKGSYLAGLDTALSLIRTNTK